MTEIEREILTLFRRLTPRGKQQCAEIIQAMSTQNAQQAEASKTAQKEAAV